MALVGKYILNNFASIYHDIYIADSVSQSNLKDWCLMANKKGWYIYNLILAIPFSFVGMFSSIYLNRMYFDHAYFPEIEWLFVLIATFAILIVIGWWLFKSNEVNSDYEKLFIISFLIPLVTILCFYIPILFKSNLPILTGFPCYLSFAVLILILISTIWRKRRIFEKAEQILLEKISQSRKLADEEASTEF